MKRPGISKVIAAAALMMGLAFAPVSEAAPPVDYVPVAGQSSVTVAGGSTLHDWSATSSEVQGHIRLPGVWKSGNGEATLEAQWERPEETTPEIVVRIASKSLKSGTGGLDEKMHEALETDRHPVIRYQLDEVVSTGTNRWSTRGRLTVAGTTRPIDLELVVEQRGDGTVVVTTETSLRMTHYGIDPPRAMLGAVRAHDPVEIKARWLLARQTPQPTAPAAGASDSHRQAVSELLKAYQGVGSALAGGELAEATAGLEQFMSALDRADAVDSGGLENTARANWEQSLARIRGAAGTAQRARSVPAARASFIIVSQGLGSLIEAVGHNEDSAVMAVRRAGQSGLAGSSWIELSEVRELRSPFDGTQLDRSGVEVAALYLSRPLEGTGR